MWNYNKTLHFTEICVRGDKLYISVENVSVTDLNIRKLIISA